MELVLEQRSKYRRRQRCPREYPLRVEPLWARDKIPAEVCKTNERLSTHCPIVHARRTRNMGDKLGVTL